ncbi:MAG: class B sortase [Bilifractor sp.]
MEKSKNIQFLIYAVLLLIIVGCAMYLIPEIAEYYNSARTYRRLRQESMITPGEPAVDAAQESAKDPVINWELYRDMDIVAWLILDDISYPVMQGTDNNTYLHALPDRTPNYGGSIFLEAANASSFTDQNSILYGHNMADGSMFGRLPSRYTDKSFKDHSFTLYLPDGTRHTYAFYSVLPTYSGSEIYTCHFGSDMTFRRWQEKRRAESLYMNAAMPADHARFVTLSTCNGSAGTRKRFVIIGIETEVMVTQEPASWRSSQWKGEQEKTGRNIQSRLHVS